MARKFNYNNATKIIKNYNNRINYYKKRGYDVPEPTSLSAIKKYYAGNEKAMFNRLSQLKDYNIKSAKEIVSVGKYGVNLNKYRYEKFLTNKEFALKKLKSEIESSQVRDKSEGYRLPSERTRGLIARKETIEYGLKKTSTKKQIQAAMKYTNYYTEQRLKMDEQFYQNFMEMFTTQASLAKVPPEVMKDIEAQFRQLEPNDLLEMFENEPDVKQVVNNYNLAKDIGDEFMTEAEQSSEYQKFIALREYLPSIISKYKK